MSKGLITFLGVVAVIIAVIYALNRIPYTRDDLHKQFTRPTPAPTSTPAIDPYSIAALNKNVAFWKGGDAVCRGANIGASGQAEMMTFNLEGHHIQLTCVIVRKDGDAKVAYPAKPPKGLWTLSMIANSK